MVGCLERLWDSGLFEDGADISLSMGGSLGGVVIVDVKDIVVVESVVDVNIAVKEFSKNRPLGRFFL